MNPQFKQNILKAIATNRVVNTSRWGSSSYVVYTPQNQKLIEVVADSDYGAYRLTVGDTVVLAADINTTHKNMPVDSIVREINEICTACYKRQQEQTKAADTNSPMSAQEEKLSAFLFNASMMHGKQ